MASQSLFAVSLTSLFVLFLAVIMMSRWKWDGFSDVVFRVHWPNGGSSVNTEYNKVCINSTSSLFWVNSFPSFWPEDVDGDGGFCVVSGVVQGPPWVFWWLVDDLVLIVSLGHYDRSGCVSSTPSGIISMGWCKKDVTPLLTHWCYVFLALTHRSGQHWVHFSSCCLGGSVLWLHRCVYCPR